MRVLPLVCLFLVLSASALRADDGALPRTDDGVLRLNSKDRFLISLVERGLRESETFRDLYRRLEHSDVIVHLRRGPQRLQAHGYNQFVTTAGGFRFLQITLSVHELTDDAVALLGHELQHAVELASEPEVTDVRGYEQMYERIGHRSCASVSERGRCFDTHEAARVGVMVRSELRASKSAARSSAAAAADLVRSWLSRVAVLADQRHRR